MQNFSKPKVQNDSIEIDRKSIEGNQLLGKTSAENNIIDKLK